MRNNNSNAFASLKDGKYKFKRPISESELLEFVANLLENKATVYGGFFDSSEKVASLISLKLSMYDREVFACLFLNSKNQLISFDKMFFGSTNKACVFISEIAKKALSLNSVGVIIAHNHPSGNLDPSGADRNITTKIKKALALFEIELIDHVVVGKTGESYSFKVNNMMNDYDRNQLGGYW